MRIVIPLLQHVGKPATAVVSSGDYVDRGMLIAKPEGLGANIHASLSGLVKEVNSKEIVIEAASLEEEVFVPIKETRDPLEAIREAGIVGAGGAGFPTYVKVESIKNARLVVANGTECEPLLQHNLRFMQENPESLARGLKYLQEITGAPLAVVVLKRKNYRLAAVLEKAFAADKRVRVKLLPDLYPAGDERVVVRELIGLELEPGQLPSEAGVLVQNVETIKRVAEAVELRKPFISKDITVAGRVMGAAKGRTFMDVAIGLPAGFFINAAGGFLEPHGEIVIGGPFTGKSGTEKSPVTKTTGGIMVGMPFPQAEGLLGLLACECGAQEDRLEEIARGMGVEVTVMVRCKRMEEVNGRYRCSKPGVCPGQAESVFALKNKGARAILAGSCED